ncbi:oxidoreductase [uncultured Ramlibacter sp.]|uniref:oxidoreductase n=1 Tax=uncultured Ramlibacter sp. TaxID=260755 RepID=UPI002632EE80|nr:oxidoreductase [uncultured Ramlibacter sp.]
MTDKTLRVGVVGYGFAGKTFHAPVLAGVPGLELTAVASSDAAKVHADWPGLEVHADPHTLFARPDIDLVVIATPNDSHHSMARAALLAGKHVVVDKPFTQTLAEAQDLAALAGSQRRVLSVFQNRRFDGDFLTLRRLLAGGELGQVVYVESHFDRYRPQVLPRWRDRPGAGGIWPDLGSHLADQALQLFGLPDAISADMAPIRDGAVTEDYFHVQLRYAKGAHAGLRVVLHATTIAAEAAPRFLVHGKLGSYSKRGVDVQEDALKAGGRPQLQALGEWGKDDRDGLLTLPTGLRSVPTLPGNYLAYYAAVRDAILGRGENPVPPEQAVQLMALLELGRRSAHERRELEVAVLPTGRP